jgi:hypothetical protein
MWLWSLVLVVGSASEVGEGADWVFRPGEPEFVVLVGSGSVNPASRYVLLRPKFVIRVMRVRWVVKVVEEKANRNFDDHRRQYA